MRMNYVQRLAVLGWAFASWLRPVQADGDLPQARQDFSADPQWDGLNNRTDKTPCRTTIAGFRLQPRTRPMPVGHPARSAVMMQVAADLACYAQRLPKPLTFKDRLSASGRVAFPDRRTGARS